MVVKHCEWRPYPRIPRVCFKPVTHQLHGVAGEVDTDRSYIIIWYVCEEHAMEGVSWGYSITFNLETDRVEGVYAD